MEGMMIEFHGVVYCKRLLPGPIRSHILRDSGALPHHIVALAEHLGVVGTHGPQALPTPSGPRWPPGPPGGARHLEGYRAQWVWDRCVSPFRAGWLVV